MRSAIRLQRRLLILCIEDNKTHLRLRKAVLERNGYFVLGTGNATDHMLRGVTGIQLATRMKRLKAEVPIVLYSGKPPESMENVDCFIHKGESPEHFLSMIGNLVKRSAQ